MSFTRTESGLSNLALFCNVDLIVYTEGGQESFSFEDMVDGEFNSQSVDIKFWDSIFQKHGFNKTIQFRAIGSKSSLLKICKLIVANKIRNVIVTLDSDLDDFIGNKFTSPFILYTRGYSWENDVYHPDLVKEQIANLVLSTDIPHEYIETLNTAYLKFNHQAPRLLKIELIFRKNKQRFITDCRGERFIDGKSSPHLKIDQILKLIEDRKKLLPSPVSIPVITGTICPIQYCYGKLREALGISLISYICRKISGIKSFPKDLIITAMIERYRNRLAHPEDQYYLEAISNLKAAT